MVVCKKNITYVIDLSDEISENDYYKRSVCNMELGQYKEADIDARYALEINPYNTEIIKIRSECLLKQKKYQDMIEFAEDIIADIESEINGNNFLQFDRKNLEQSLQIGLEIKSLGLKLIDESCKDNNIDSIFKIEQERPRKNQSLGNKIVDEVAESPDSLTNPAIMSVEWKVIIEKASNVAGGTVSQISGAFELNRAQANAKSLSQFLPQEKFAIAIIDHSYILIKGYKYDGKSEISYYCSNEMRMSDVMTTPFKLEIRYAGHKSKITTHIGSYQELKEKLNISGRLHLIYGLTSVGEIIKLVIPHYAYSLGNENYKTHGDTFLDAHAKSVKGGMNNCWLTYDGFNLINYGSGNSTVPKFKFDKRLPDDILTTISSSRNILNKWYKKYHDINVKDIVNIQNS
jgi:hypothetical protein